MRFSSRSFFYLFKTLITLITICLLVLVGLNYTKLIITRGINTSYKEHIGYFFDSILLTKNFILRKIDLKSIQNPKIPKIYLDIENHSLDKIISNLSEPDQIKKYYNATILYPDGVTRKIKYRVRGANIWHWDKEKPSLRIKTKKKFPINLHRHLNFVSPEDILMISNPFGEELARYFGLLAHNTQMIDLYINKKYTGVYQLLNREDESFLRYNKRFPGPIYNGDSLSRKWESKDFKIYGDDSIIEKFKYFDSKNNKFQFIEINNPMQKLTDIINRKPSFEEFSNLWSIIDKEKLASFSALMAITVGTHSNFHHNQNFYFDPTLGKIEPVISDMNILGLLLKPGGKYRYINAETNPLDIYSKKNNLPYFSIPIYEKITPMLDIAFADPSFVYLRNKKIYQALQSYASSENQISLLNNMIDLIYNSVLSDPNKGALVNSFSGYLRYPYSNNNFIKERTIVEKFIRNRNKYLIDELNKVDVSINKTKITEKEVFFNVTVNGDSAVLLDLNQFLKAEDIKINNKSKYNKFDSTKLLLHSNLIRAFSEEIQTHDFKRNLLGDDRFKEYTFKKHPKSYEFKISKKNYEILFKNKNKIFLNAITGKKVTFKGISNNNIQNEIHTIEMKNNFIKDNQKIFLGPGRIEINKNLYIKENQTLIIKPGTDLLINNNISIFSRGKIIAKGTDNNPISISPLDRKWGVLALVGKNASGSIFKNLNIIGGSIDKIDNIYFSGMLSLHHVPYAELINIKLENNFYGDDTLRILSSKIKINNIEVNYCNGDCIDFDYAEGDISNIKMKNAGNDGLDFMTSNIKIKNYTIDKCGDKGMSLGENSKITGSTIKINDCDIGIASKDRSIGSFDNVFISNSNIGLSTYVKNWRYGVPGIIEIKKKNFTNNKNNEKLNFSNNLNLKQKDYYKKLYW